MKIRPGLTSWGLTASGATSDLIYTSVGNVLRQRFFAIALETPAVASSEGWTDLAGDKMAETLAMLLAGWECSSAEDDDRLAWLASSDDLHVFVSVGTGGAWNVHVAGPDTETVAATLKRLTGAFPVPDLEGEQAIAVQFWAMGAMGPISYQRRLDVTPWSESAGNYPTDVRDQLEELMALRAPTSGGRLALLHGPPGTGKTHLIRSLAHAWKDWCDVDYIVDADEFFRTAAYMITALVMGNDYSDRWRVVVIEDAGEFLVADARERIGQGLARLLNLSDGLVGQGLKLLIVMTTNEPADELHEAVTRPGRCLSNIGFIPFPVDEAREWLAAQGFPDSELAAELVDGPMTLAQLFAER